MIRLSNAAVLAACLALPLPYGASAQVLAPPQNVLQLSATGTMEVQQDLLSLTLATTREGADAANVQRELKAALEAALGEARKAAAPGQMDVRTGQFALYPRYAQGGKISGWQGTAELVLQGRDFARISQTAGKIPGMTVARVGFGLSREQRAKVEGEVQAIAIERFKAKAGELARGFGFGGYGLREVSVNSNDQIIQPRERMMAAGVSAQEAAIPVEAGKSTVVITVSGSVQLR